MKHFFYSLFMGSILLLGCGPKELSRSEAAEIIQKAHNFPKVLDYQISCGDPEAARKVMDMGLEQNGYLLVQKTQKLSEIGNPLVSFTPKAQPYLLPTPEEDKKYNRQLVKVADEAFGSITGLAMGSDGKTATVEYTTKYENISPFSVLMKRDFTKEAVHKAYVVKYDDGWREQ